MAVRRPAGHAEPMTTDPTGSAQDPSPDPSLDPSPDPSPDPSQDPSAGPSAGGAAPGPRRNARDPRDLGALRRSTTDRHIAGVAGGLARHLDVDPVIIRVALVVLIFFGGAGLIIYGGLWLLVPQDGEDTAMISLDPRSRVFLLYAVGAVAALALLGDTLGHLHVPWGLLVAAVVVVAVLGSRDRLGLRGPSRRAQEREPDPGAPLTYDAGIAPDPRDEPTGGGVATATRVTRDPVAPTYVAPPPRPADPRRRGPILFWFTLALIALAEGVLGMVDLAGAHIAGPAYPALAVGIIGLMLLVGSFFGRAGGLILVGLIASLVLAASLAADKWQLDGHSHSHHYLPATSSAVRDSYAMGTGELVVDLSQVSDPAALAGRSIDVHGHVGSLDVIVPPGIAVTAEGVVHGPGQVTIFSDGRGGLHSQLSGSQDGTGTPLDITAELNVGQITVEQP